MFPRSIAGCYTCKARKKKCDEARPKCQRCIRGGFECGGYAPLNNPDSKGVMRRSKVPPVSESHQPSTGSSEIPSLSYPGGSVPIRQAGFQGSIPIDEPVASAAGDPRYNLGSAPGVPLRGRPAHIYQDLEFHSGSLAWAELRVPSSSLSNSAVNSPSTFSVSHPTPNELVVSSPSSSSGRSSSTNSYSSRSSSDISQYSFNIRPTKPPILANSGKGVPLRALSSISESRSDLPGYSLYNPIDRESCIVHGPAWSPPTPGMSARIEELDTDDEDDPEGVTSALCRGVTPDRNTLDNSLPFVLQCYARWVNFVMFDPLRVIHLIRDNIIAQFSNSAGSRTRVILMSNVLGSLSKSPGLDPKGSSLVALLRIEACQAMEQYRSTRFTGERDIDVREALQTLGQTSEIIIVQRYTGRFADIAKLMQSAAPVFRKACPEPPGQPVNLPNILLHPDLNLRGFAATDVLISITKARPMLFKYDVSHTPEVAEQMADGEFGLQWLHGIPDQALILLARINLLHGEFRTYVDPRCISDIEEKIRNIKVRPPGIPADPFATIWRLTVHECWRQTVYIYLYMVLCGAQANDPRVLKAVRTFTRLVDGVRPGRNPDSFLFIPIMVAGASAYEARDREILRQRMLGLQECITTGTTGHESLLIMIDIWERTEVENRPAVWQDLTIASRKIAG